METSKQMCKSKICEKVQYICFGAMFICVIQVPRSLLYWMVFLYEEDPDNQVLKLRLYSVLIIETVSAEIH